MDGAVGQGVSLLGTLACEVVTICDHLRAGLVRPRDS
jgi:hypothetical protein